MKPWIKGAVAAAILLTGGGLFAANVPTASAGPAACTFKTVGSFWRLQADCVTTTTIAIPSGLKLDGQGHTIVVDTTGDPATAPNPVIQNNGTVFGVQNVTIDASAIDFPEVEDDCAVVAINVLANSIGDIKDTTIRFPDDPDCGTTGIALGQGGGGTVNLTRVSVSNFTADGVHANGPVGGLIIDSTFSGATAGYTGQFTARGLYLAASAGWKIRNSTISGGGVGVGVYGDGVRNLEVSGTLFAGLRGYGIILQGEPGMPADGPYFTGNTFDHVEATPILLDACNISPNASTINGGRIMANVFRRGSPAVAVQLGADCGAIDGTSITRNTFDGWINVADAIAQQGDTRTTIAANSSIDEGWYDCSLQPQGEIHILC
jgi:hypothetical protein